MRNVLLLIIVVMLMACSEYKMDSFESWCNYQSEDIEADVVSIDRNAIRKDFVKFLNDMYMKKVEGRIDRMVWMEGRHLHIENLSTLFVIEPSEIINRYRSGIIQYRENKIKDYMERCFYGVIFNFFDDVTIHSGELDNLGVNWKYKNTLIETKRRKYFSKSKIPVIRKIVENPDF